MIALASTKSEAKRIVPAGPITFELAQAIALKQNRRVLVLTGLLDGPNGLPSGQARLGSEMRLKMMRSYTTRLTTGIFEVDNEDALCELTDELQDVGGYRGFVISESGDLDPSYTL